MIYGWRPIPKLMYTVQAFDRVCDNADILYNIDLIYLLKGSNRVDLIHTILLPVENSVTLSSENSPAAVL
jgi:hypothetical protein